MLLFVFSENFIKKWARATQLYLASHIRPATACLRPLFEPLPVQVLLQKLPLTAVVVVVADVVIAVGVGVEAVVGVASIRWWLPERRINIVLKKMPWLETSLYQGSSKLLLTISRSQIVKLGYITLMVIIKSRLKCNDCYCFHSVYVITLL